MSPTALVVHGGGGPATVAGLVAHLSQGYEVTAPTVPGFNDTASVPGDTIAALAARLLDQLHADHVTDAVIVGSSMGGWIAAEMAAQDGALDVSERHIARVVLIDAVGIEVPGSPIRDFFALSPREVAEYSWADADRGYIDPATRTPQQLATMRGNIASLRDYSEHPYMHDPTLFDRLGAIAVPVLVVWGEADRIVTPEYGRAFAAAIPNAEFELVQDAGHLPHLEQPVPTLEAIDMFLAESR